MDIASSSSQEITTVHPDIAGTHILPRLDGPTLAAAACASSQFHSLCTQEKLWRDVCKSTWPSTNDPRVRSAVSTFPAGYRSFFSDSFPCTFHRDTSPPDHSRQSPTPKLISAVDIHFQDKLVYSKVIVTETVTHGFLSSPLLVEPNDPKETVTTPLKLEGDSKGPLISHLEQFMSVSWIMIDPTRNRAANLSSLRPVSVCRHWIADEIKLLYATVIGGVDGRTGSSKVVECRIEVTCGGAEGGELHVREVNLHVQDMDGKGLSGEESLVILQGAMQGGRRKLGKRGEERERYREYLEMKRERKQRKHRDERRLDMVCTVIRIIIFIALMWVITSPLI